MNHIKIGKIVATFGVNGEIILVHNLGKKTVFKDIEALFVEKIKGSLIPFFISSNKSKTIEENYVLFEDIKSKEAAKMLIGKAVWLLQDDFKKLADKKSPIALLGYKVFNNKDEIGIVEEVIEQPHQILLTITYKGKEAYLPMHQDSLVNINYKTNEIILNLPEGLLDIYL
jgi:16S rRNA processing protein RimM